MLLYTKYDGSNIAIGVGVTAGRPIIARFFRVSMNCFCLTLCIWTTSHVFYSAFQNPDRESLLMKHKADNHSLGAHRKASEVTEYV